MLGRHMKYSCCLFDEHDSSKDHDLHQAERAMLDLYFERAGLAELKERGGKILDLGLVVLTDLGSVLM